jgi:hypothetical protein
MCIVVLDELDQACKKADSFVKELFKLPKIENSRLIVIGIANRMDLAERVLKDVGSKADVAPRMISFHSYSARQLLELLKVCALSDQLPVSQPPRHSRGPSMACMFISCNDVSLLDRQCCHMRCQLGSQGSPPDMFRAPFVPTLQDVLYQVVAECALQVSTRKVLLPLPSNSFFWHTTLRYTPAG